MTQLRRLQIDEIVRYGMTSKSISGDVLRGGLGHESNELQRAVIIVRKLKANKTIDGVDHRGSPTSAPLPAMITLESAVDSENFHYLFNETNTTDFEYWATVAQANFALKETTLAGQFTFHPHANMRYRVRLSSESPSCHVMVL